MKVRYSLPRGYSADITDARENNDFDGWIDRKFGAFIRDTIASDFTMEIDDTGFTVDFVFETDGDVFLKTVGGRIVE